MTRGRSGYSGSDGAAKGRVHRGPAGWTSAPPRGTIAGTARRGLLLFGMPAVAMALAIGIWLLWPSSAITRKNADKIKAGMTLAEVEAILGEPPGIDGGQAPAVMPTGERLLVGQQWVGPEVVITVAFDATGRAQKSQLHNVVRPQTVPAMRRWLRL